MELNKNLNILTERAWALFDRINDEIRDDDGLGFCRLCSENGRYCGIAETPLEERERLIAIRDSLKDVENMLVFLQKLESRQESDLNAAFTCLEESRKVLIEKVNRFPEKWRKLDVLEELNACLGDGKTAFSWNFKERVEEKIEPAMKNRISGFLIHCIRSLFNLRNWDSTARIAIKLIVLSASISYTFHFCQTRKQYNSPQTKIISSVDSEMARKLDTFLSNPNSHLDVSYGRG